MMREEGTGMRWTVVCMIGLVASLAVFVPQTDVWAQGSDGAGEDEPEASPSRKDKKAEEVIEDLVGTADPETGFEATNERATRKEPLKLNFRLGSEVHSFENLDFLALDETTDENVLITDDRSTFAYSRITANAEYRVNRDLVVAVGMAHNGLWAEDQLGSEAEATGVFNFSALNFEYQLLRTGSLKVSTKVGRRRFKIGGVPNDYMFDDNIDALTFKVWMGQAGTLRILAADFFAQNDLADTSFVRYVSGRRSTLGLRGDSYTLRTGGIYENDKILDGLNVKGYYFFADIGGGPITETGADVSYGGTLGNFSDNDYTYMFGARANYEFGSKETTWLNVYGEYAQSGGIDRKEVVARDVETSGSAYGGGLEAKINLGGPSLSVGADFYHFDGAEYAGDGLEFKRGFTSFKGRQVGGLALSRYAGWSPSARLNTAGVEHHPHDIARSGGTEFIHAGAAFTLADVTLRGDGWILTDTGSTFFDQNEIDTVTVPFGYTREEFAAQERLGKSLGTEIDVQLRWKADENTEFYGIYSTFLPGEFYETRIDRVVGSRTASLGSEDNLENFWAVTAGAVVSF